MTFFSAGGSARRCAAIVAVAGAVLAPATTAHADDAVGDTTFGTGGTTLLTDPFPYTSPGRSTARSLPVDIEPSADGRVTMLLNAVSAFDFDGPPRSRIVRLLPSGDPDPSFAAGGKPGESAALDDLLGDRIASAIDVAADGSVLILAGNDGHAPELVKLTPSGALDTSFGPNGSAVRVLDTECVTPVQTAKPAGGGFATLLSNCGGQSTRARAIIVGPTDPYQLLVVRRDGTVDTQRSHPLPQTYGDRVTGFAVRDTPDGLVADLASRSYGGPQDGLAAIERFGTTGALDTAFADNGRYLREGLFTDLDTLPSGGTQAVFLKAKSGALDDNARTEVLRLTSSGALDTAFATGGIASFPLIRSDLDADKLALIGIDELVERSGRTVLLSIALPVGPNGTAEDLSKARFFLTRLLADGTVDPSWGTNGIAEVTPQLSPGLVPDGATLVLLRFGIYGGGLQAEPLAQTFPNGQTAAFIPAVPEPNQSGLARRADAPQGGLVIRRSAGIDPTVAPQPAAPAPATPAAAPAPAATPAPTKAQSRSCVSRRAFTIRLRPRGAALRSATVTVNGRAVTVRKGKRFTARVVLTGRPPVQVVVRVVAKGRNGRTYRETRRYLTCRYQGRPLKDITVG